MKQIKLGEFHFKKVLEMLIEIMYLSVFFAVPLMMAFFFKTDNVFELNKVILFRSLIYILFALTLAKILFFSDKQKFPWRYLVPVSALMAFSFISLFFSVDPVTSYYGLNDRQQGCQGLLFYIGWFILLFYNLVAAENIDERLERIFWIIMSSSFLVSLYAILQILGIDFIAWTEPAFVTHRTTSTLGQPNYLGSYLILVIPLAIYGLAKYRRFWPRFMLGILLAFQLVALVTTGSRAAWLGLLVGLALLTFWSLSRVWPRISYPKKRGIILISIISVLMAVLLLSQSSYVAGRLKGITDFKQGSVSARFNFWSGALESFVKKPFWGYGLETQGTEFIKYYRVDWARTGFVNASTNRAHNLILDILLTGGVIGLLLYAWVYGSFFKWAKQLRSNSKYRLLSDIFIVAVLAYLVSLLFGFAVVVTEVYFFSYLAIVAAINARLKGDRGIVLQIKLRNWIKVVIIILAMAFSGNQIINGFRYLVADNYFLEMRQVLNQDNYSKALFFYQKIKEQDVVNFDYTYYLVDALPYSLEANISPEIVYLFQKELAGILPELTLDNYDHYYLKAKIYATLKDYSQAEYYYQKIIAISPELPKNYFSRAKFYIASGRDDLALVDLKKVLELLPPTDNPVATQPGLERSISYYRSLVYKDLGDLYSRQKKYDLAGESYRSAYLLNLSDLASYKKMADMSFMQGDLKKAVWYNLRAFERHPDDYVWPFSLAVLYGQQGDHENAIKYLDLAIGLDVNKKISSGVIDNIKKGK